MRKSYSTIAFARIYIYGKKNLCVSVFIPFWWANSSLFFWLISSLMKLSTSYVRNISNISVLFRTRAHYCDTSRFWGLIIVGNWSEITFNLSGNKANKRVYFECNHSGVFPFRWYIRKTVHDLLSILNYLRQIILILKVLIDLWSSFFCTSKMNLLTQLKNNCIVPSDTERWLIKYVSHWTHFPSL